MPPTDLTLPVAVDWADRLAITGPPSVLLAVTKDDDVATGPFSTTGTSTFGLALFSVVVHDPL